MSIRRAAALVLLAACILALVLSISSAPDLFVYNLLSPKAEAPQEQAPPAEGEEDGEEKAPKELPLSALGSLLKRLDSVLEELSTAVKAYGVVALTPKYAFTDGEQGSGSGGLEGIWGPAGLAPRKTLSSGRHLYPEEIESGARVAVIDEGLALAVYRVGDPLGRKLVIGGQPFEIVGVTRYSRHPGDLEESWAQVPLKALDQLHVQTLMLSVQMKPIAGAGAYAALSQAMTQWQDGGSFDSLPKERYRALLPLRYLLCAVALMAVGITMKLARRYTLRLWHGGRRRLQSSYAERLLPEFIGRGLLIALMYAFNLFLIFLILQEMIAPVYVFPEWVPTVLVEPKEIQKTFWTLRAQQTSLLALRTPELLRLQFLLRLMGVACLSFGILLLKPWHTLKRFISSLS